MSRAEQVQKAALVAADVAKRAAESAKGFAQHEAQAFAAQPKFFRYRVYIVAAYVATIALTVLLMLPSAPRNRLDAYVLPARGDFILGTYILVRNDSGGDWHDVTFTVNGEHTLKTDWVVRGQSFPVKLKQLVPPVDAKEVREIRVACSRGSERYDVSFGSTQ